MNQKNARPSKQNHLILKVLNWMFSAVFFGLIKIYFLIPKLIDRGKNMLRKVKSTEVIHPTKEKQMEFPKLEISNKAAR